MTSVMVRRHGRSDDALMKEAACLLCERDSQTVPLISMQYRGGTIRVCPQHLPVMIHDPGQLIGRLEGAEAFRPSEIHD